MGAPSPLAKVLAFAPRPTRDPHTHVAVHTDPTVALDAHPYVASWSASSTDRPQGRGRADHPAGDRYTSPTVPSLFDWAVHPDQPPMPTLISCALDRLGQFVSSPGLITREQANEALLTIRSHYRPDHETGD